MLLAAVALAFGFVQQDLNPPYSVHRLSGFDIPGLPEVDGHFRVDQFGYLPSETKVAVIADPIKGYNAWDHYTPPAKLQLRTRDGKTVFIGSATAWKDGATDDDSGDRGWWFDFSSVKAPGEYYVYDPSTKHRSPVFQIGPTVFGKVLKAASRMFYYQRLGIPLEAKYAGKAWAADAAEVQDQHTRSIEAKDNASLERDLSGGWMDAGDSDKYPPFNADVLHPMLYAYTSNPKAFGDDFGIPESGNGLPDILDEIKYQLDWLVRMQFSDGSVPVKMGDTGYNGTRVLSDDHRQRYYGPKDSGATIFTCAIFAHAARVYGQFPAWKAFADGLQAKALLAWDWFNTHPRTYKSDTGVIDSGIANRSDDEQNRMEAFAAIHLLALTGDQKFQDPIRKFAGGARQLSEGVWSPYEAGSSEALVDYLSLPNADPELVQKIRDKLTQSAMNPHFNPDPSADLYRAWMEPTNYHWGSNDVRACWGVVCLLAAKYGSGDAAMKERLRQRAADMLHSFHGVNPLGVVYLSNMDSYGAENSIRAFYHARWGAGSDYDKNPPPGYVVGGPNQSFGGKSAAGRPSLDWIRAQPRGKAYADFNLAWPESSWELSEPAIYYQAMYVRLVSAFAAGN